MHGQRDGTEASHGQGSAVMDILYSLVCGTVYLARGKAHTSEGGRGEAPRPSPHLSSQKMHRICLPNLKICVGVSSPYSIINSARISNMDIYYCCMMLLPQNLHQISHSSSTAAAAESSSATSQQKQKRKISLSRCYSRKERKIYN